MVKRKIPSPCRESNPRTPIVQPVAQRYHDSKEEEKEENIINFKVGHHGLLRFRILTSEIYESILDIW
jgi:hypothetical protein